MPVEVKVQTFKECPSCHHAWREREEFLSDPTLRVVGYQANMANMMAGLFLFQHDVPECGTSLAIAAEEFADMHRGPIFEKCLYGTDRCPGYCMSSQSLLPCPAKCECAYVRDVLQEIRLRLAAARHIARHPVT